MTAELQIDKGTRLSLASRTRGLPAPGDSTLWRGVYAAVGVAIATGIAAAIATRAAGVSLRDPGHVTVTRLGITSLLFALVVLVDTAVRASRRSPRRFPSVAALRSAGRERWTPPRVAAVVIALLSFYATYWAYRNLKSVVPVLRPGDLYDRQLTDLDSTLIGGGDPASALHSLLGTDIAAHVLSSVYMLFFAFIPLCLCLALVLSADIRGGLFFTVALSLNWMVGAASYFVFPSIGPFHVDPATFGALPHTSVTELQETLIEGRSAFLQDPSAAGATQSIGAFASLHVSIFFTAAVAAQLLGLGRTLKSGAWVLTALTATATIYFGWHYILDDIGGVAIAVLALALARALTGIDLGNARALRRVPAPEPA